MRSPINRIASMLVNIIVFAGGTYGQRTDTSNADVAVLTVCEALDHLNQLNGRTVVLVGKLVSTEEGQWLSQECERKLVTEGYTWLSTISLTYDHSTVKPPNIQDAFKWNERLLQDKLRQVQKTTQLVVLKQYNYSDKWFAMFGRLETRIPPQVAIGGDGKPHGNGFGHLGAAPARLVSAKNGGHELRPDNK